MTDPYPETSHPVPGLPETGPSGAGRPARRDRRRKAARITGAAAMAVGLAVGATAVAGAATGGTPASTTQPATAPSWGGPGGPGRTPPAAVGTVASVGTSSFTVTAAGGSTVTVDVTSSTTYRDRGVTSPTLADVKVGDRVAVFGTKTGTTVAATSVGIGMPGMPGGPGGPGRWGGPGGSAPAA